MSIGPQLADAPQRKPTRAATVIAEAVDLPAIQVWLEARGLEVTGPLTAELIQGGRSNLTFFLTDATRRRWVYRRPPLGPVLRTAHDVGREFTVMSALADTSVPVPRTVGLGEDAQAVPFYVMEEVVGLVARDAACAQAHLSVPARTRTGPALVEALAALHAADPEQLGLGGLGRRGDDYLGRQITLWQRQAEQHRRVGFAEADAVRNRLLSALPVQQETTLVHGDYRLDNAIVDHRGELRAVVDWELCTRGDPIADLAVFLYYWTEATDPVQPFPAPATVLPGFTDRAGLLEHYRTISGREPTRLDYYLGYAAWRLALVFEGIAARSAVGAYGDSDGDEERRLSDAARQLVKHAHILLDRDRP